MMELNSYLILTVAAIGICTAIILSFAVFRVKPRNLFKFPVFFIKSLLALLTVGFILSGIGILGTSLLAVLRHDPVLPGLVSLALLLVLIGAGLAWFIGFGIMTDDDVNLEDV